MNLSTISSLWIPVAVFGIASCVPSEDEKHIANWTAQFSELVSYRLCYNDQWWHPTDCSRENVSKSDADKAGYEFARCWASAATDLAQSGGLEISDVLVGREDDWVDFESISESEFGSRIKDCRRTAFRKHGFR